MKKITYVFTNNRKKNFLENNIDAREFYYGLDKFSNGNEVTVLEFDDKSRRILQFIDKFISKFLSLPFYSSKMTSLKNLKTFYHSDHIFLINEGVGFASLFLLLITRILNPKIKVSLFVMGLYSKSINYKYFVFFHNLLIKFLILQIDNVLFLGKGELIRAKKIHNSKSIKKFKFVPFCIDTDFWSSKDDFGSRKKDSIIFVGNDNNRDFKILFKLAKELEKIKFIIVSSNPIFKKLKLPNVEIIEGSWGSSKVSDFDLKQLYEKSKLSIIPLKESFQPSGQSVALQSMSLGLPVIITKTKGFWQNELFENKKNILFVNSSNLVDWVNLISEIYYKDEELLKISQNAKTTVVENYNLQNFYKILHDLVF